MEGSPAAEDNGRRQISRRAELGRPAAARGRRGAQVREAEAARVRARTGLEAAQLNRAHCVSCTAWTPRKAGGDAVLAMAGLARRASRGPTAGQVGAGQACGMDRAGLMGCSLRSNSGPGEGSSGVTSGLATSGRAGLKAIGCGELRGFQRT
jgi:hypothetical protein